MGVNPLFTPCYLLRSRIFVYALKLAFWVGLAYGIWLIGSGLYEGPNFTAKHRVTVEEVHPWWQDWIVHYHYVAADGDERSGRVKVKSAGEIVRTSTAQPGDRIDLRIPVDADDPNARFSINHDVSIGLMTVLELLLLADFFRNRDLLIDDEKTGKLRQNRLYLPEFLLRLFGVMIFILWLDGWLGIPA